VVELDSDQQAVIADCRGARSVIAGPGAGKTSTMVALIQSLISSGVSSSEIKAVTFSTEMAKSLEKKLKVPGIVSTFHSRGYTICSETERKPVEPELRYRLMCKLCKKWKLDYKEFDSFIEQMRRTAVTPIQGIACGEHDYGKVSAYAEYERERAAGGWMDFTSMLCDAISLLENNPQARARQQVRYLVVDESQDTDSVQFRLAQLLTEKHGNVTFVGDKNQCIYSFRGATPENIDRDFHKWFPNGKRLFLGRNYRSTETITNFVRENAPEDTPKELLDRMQAVRNVKGAPIGLKMYWTDDAEAECALRHDFDFSAARIAAHTVSGVAGISTCSTP